MAYKEDDMAFRLPFSYRNYFCVWDPCWAPSQTLDGVTHVETSNPSLPVEIRLIDPGLFALQVMHMGVRHC